MSDCVFDIETAPLEDADIPAALVEKLKDAESDDPEAWRERLALYAPAASAVVIGMLNPQTRRGELLYDARHGELDSIECPESYEVSLFGGSEKEILAHFWQSVARFDRVITYNGRGFDVPFLMQRSLIQEVPVGINLMPYRYRTDTNHLDLADVISQFKATRPYGLATWTQAVGATSPKEGSVSGAGVGEAFHAGRVQEIAEYCMRDVVATALLAEKVSRLWGPILGGRH